MKSSIKKNTLKFIICCALCLMQFYSFSQETAAPTESTIKKVEVPAGFTANIDDVYTTVNDWNGRMDVYFQQNALKPTPIIINIHGGGWKNGTKEAQGGFNTFFKAGISVANVEYRMTGQATAPAAVEDIRCALIYLIKNAKKYNIDVNKIVIMGGSAGGHLALMGGLLGNNHIFDTNCMGVEKIKVAAIVDKYGIADVWDWAYGIHGPEVKKSKSPTDWLGPKKDDEAFAKSVSPIHYVDKTSPPTIIIHGNADSTVPYQQSVLLHKKFMDAGVKTEFITVEGGGHGKFDKEKNIELGKAIIKFITELDAFKN